jgi:Outer membrane protein beta-barrel domain
MTKLTRRWIPVFALVLLSPLAARAAAVDTHAVELNGFFSFDHTSASIETPAGDIDIGRTIFDLEPGLGYFFNPNWELLGSLIIRHESEGGFSTDNFGLKADALYHFNTTGTIIPFAGAGLGMLTNGGDSDADKTSVIVPELLVGVRWPFKSIVSFNFLGGYRHITNFRGSDESGDSFFLGAGFSVFLRGGAQ